MNELRRQAEVGQRLREAIGAGHLRTNGSGNRMIDELMASGRFTTRDKVALRRMHADTIRALHKKFAKPVKEDVDMEDDEDEEIKGMANMHRTGKALERQNARNAVAARMERTFAPRYFQITNGVTDAEAEGMIPPTYTRKAR